MFERISQILSPPAPPPPSLEVDNIMSIVFYWDPPTSDYLQWFVPQTRPDPLRSGQLGIKMSVSWRIWAGLTEQSRILIKSFVFFNWFFLQFVITIRAHNTTVCYLSLIQKTFCPFLLCWRCKCKLSCFMSFLHYHQILFLLSDEIGNILLWFTMIYIFIFLSIGILCFISTMIKPNCRYWRWSVVGKL